MTPRRGTGALVGILAAAALGTLAVHADTGRDLRPAPGTPVYVNPGELVAPIGDPCAPHLIGRDVTDGMVPALLAIGWQSDPADGLEAVYAPGCVAPDGPAR